jgi:acetylglutamate synthase
MKLKIVHAEIPEPVVMRFPHLETELHEMAMKDKEFSQLCLDYKDVVDTLKQVDAHNSDTRADLLALKTTLEVEILEQVSRRGA